MTQPARSTIILNDQDATLRLASAISELAAPGVCILLDGPVGVGKTFLARAVLHNLMHKTGKIEDVPSPTFTLVQTYDVDELEVWHADLYRLTSPDEMVELGLDAALEAAFCMIEWPDRMGDLAPATALRISLAPDAVSDDKRTAVLSGPKDHLVKLSAPFEKAPQ